MSQSARRAELALAADWALSSSAEHALPPRQFRFSLLQLPTHVFSEPCRYFFFGRLHKILDGEREMKSAQRGSLRERNHKHRNLFHSGNAVRERCTLHLSL